MKSKGTAIEKACKESVTDAMKRALRLFGNSLGNCLYDKAFNQQVSSMPKPERIFRPENLLREPSLLPPAKRFAAEPQDAPLQTPPLHPLQGRVPQPPRQAVNQIKQEKPYAVPRTTATPAKAQPDQRFPPSSSQLPNFAVPVKTEVFNQSDDETGLPKSPPWWSRFLIQIFHCGFRRRIRLLDEWS